MQPHDATPCNEDVVGGGVQTARFVEVLRQLISQQRVAFGVAVTKVLLRIAPPKIGTIGAAQFGQWGQPDIREPIV